jgi:glycerate kinase
MSSPGIGRCRAPLNRSRVEWLVLTIGWSIADDVRPQHVRAVGYVTEDAGLGWLSALDAANLPSGRSGGEDPSVDGGDVLLNLRHILESEVLQRFVVECRSEVATDLFRLCLMDDAVV